MVSCLLDDVLVVASVVVAGEFRIYRHAVLALDEVAVRVGLLSVAVHEFHEQIAGEIAVGLRRGGGHLGALGVDGGACEESVSASCLVSLPPHPAREVEIAKIKRIAKFSNM